MKKTAILLSLAVGLTACSGAANAPEKSAEEMLMSALDNSQTQESGNFALNMSGSMTAEEMTASMDGALTMAIDIRDSQNLSGEIQFELSVEDPNMGQQAFAGEAKVVDSVAYFKVDNAGPYSMFMPFPQGSWISYEILESDMAEISAAIELAKSDTPELQEATEELKSQALEVFGNLKYEGVENKGGVSSYAYSWELSEEAFINLVESGAQMEGQTMPEQDKEELMTVLEMIDVEGIVYITEEERINGIEVTLSGVAPDGEEIEFNLDYSVSNVNEDINVVAPEGAKSMEEIMAEQMASSMMIQ